MGGAYTNSWVIVKEDGSDRFLPKNLTHKYSKALAQMFHGTIIDGKKGLAMFWEKDQGGITVEAYDKHILSQIQEFFNNLVNVLEGYIFMQDNAPAHRALETRLNLFRRRIPYLKFPPYSPDLNLIEHVWNWMKNWMQEHYWEVRYRVDRVPLPQLRRIILQAWDAVPDDYIQSFYNSWWRRCQAVIDAHGGPTKY